MRLGEEFWWSCMSVRLGKTFLDKWISSVVDLQELLSTSIKKPLPPEYVKEARNLHDDLQRLIDQVKNIIKNYVVWSKPANICHNVCYPTVGNFEHLATQRKNKNKSEFIESSIVLKVNFAVYFGSHLYGVNFDPKTSQHVAEWAKTKYFCKLENVEFEHSAAFCVFCHILKFYDNCDSI